MYTIRSCIDVNVTESSTARESSETPAYGYPKVPEAASIRQCQSKTQTLAFPVLPALQPMMLGEEVPRLGNIPRRSASEIRQKAYSKVYVVPTGRLWCSSGWRCWVDRLGGEVQTAKVDRGGDVVWCDEERFLESLHGATTVV